MSIANGVALNQPDVGMAHRVTQIPMRLDPELVDKMSVLYSGPMYEIRLVEEVTQGKLCIQVYPGPMLQTWPAELDAALAAVFNADVQFRECSPDTAIGSMQCTYVVVSAPMMVSVEKYIQPRIEQLKERLDL